MSAYAKKILADYRPNRFPSGLQILKTACNVRRPYHQACSPAEIEMGVPYKVHQQRAKPYQVASGEQSEIHRVIPRLLPVKNQYVTEVQNQDKWQEPGTIVEVLT